MFKDKKIIVDDAGNNQTAAQILWAGHTIAEVSCPTKYFPGASSINFRRSLKYGFGCLWTALIFRLAKINLVKSRLFTEVRKHNKEALG